MAFMWHIDASMAFMVSRLINHMEVRWGKSYSKQVRKFSLHIFHRPKFGRKCGKRRVTCGKIISGNRIQGLYYTQKFRFPAEIYNTEISMAETLLEKKDLFAK